MNRRAVTIVVSVYGLIAAGLFAVAAYRLSLGDKRPAALLAAGGLYAIFRIFMVLQRTKQRPPPPPS